MAITLPQLSGGTFLCDGCLETSLMFHEGVELPHFAAFVLLDDETGREHLKRYYASYLELCAGLPGAGFVLDTPTWRANPDWAALLGLDAERLRVSNTQAARMICSLRDDWAARIEGPIVVSGVIGPRGDGYVAHAPGSASDAAQYHGLQAEALAEGGVDMLTTVTMTSSSEALGDAIERVDASAAPDDFAINCAHPTHFMAVLDTSAHWVQRIRGIRANASEKSHAELDEASELDIGDPSDLAQRYRGLKGALPRLNVWGGCCGTDLRHLRSIRDALA